MAETSITENASAFTQDQTTSVAENAHAVVEEPTDGGGEGAAQQQSQPQSFWDGGLMWVILIGVWAWFIFGNKKRRTERAEAKKEKERRETLQKGDKIVTIGRMHGTVVAFTETSVTIKPDNKSDYTMTFDRQAIYRVLPRPGEGDEQEEAGK